MAELNKSYKCNICGNVAKIVEAGIGELVCCGQPMAVVEEQAEAAPEAKTESSPITETPVSEAPPAESTSAPASETPMAEPTETKPEEKPSF